MPTKKQIQNAMKKLKSTPKPKGNSPKLPSKTNYIIILADPKVKREKQFARSVHEYMKMCPR